MSVTQVYTAVPNDVITAARWNNEFGQIYQNMLATNDHAALLAITLAGVAGDIVGPYSIGGAPDPNVALFIKGAFTGSTFTFGTIIRHTLTGGVNQDIACMIIDSPLHEAASGTHNEIAGLVIEPPFTGTAGAVTTSYYSLLLPPTTLDAGVVTGTTLKIFATTSAATNYALWVASGNTRLDGIVATGAVITGAAAGDVVLPIANGYRSIVAAGNNSFVLIKGVDVGSDAVHLAPAGNEIVWGRALVALGGGAAPTFGTIGGSGPATAAQNKWMQVKDSAGATFWVPIWK